MSHRIAVLVASTRTTRFADFALAWMLPKLGSYTVDVVDLRELNLPYYDLPMPPAMAFRQYSSDAERKIGERLDAADGYLVITNEFNHGYSAALKNVLDHYFIELQHKPITFLGYGNVGGSRAIEQLKQVAVELDMVPIRYTLHIFGPQMAEIRGGGEPETVLASLDVRLPPLFESLDWWLGATTAARALNVS